MFLGITKKILILIILFILMIFINSSLIFYIPFIFLHELSHLYIGTKLGYTITSLRLFPFGIAGSFKEEFINPLDDILITLSGPLMNFIFFILFSLLAKYHIFFYNISQANLVICIFNLLPAGILDGGKILRDIFKMYFSFYSAYYLININGIILGCLVFLGGLLVNVFPNNIILLLLGIYLIYIDYRNQKEIIINTIADIIKKHMYNNGFQNNKLFCTIITKDCRILSIIKGFNYLKSSLLLIFIEGRIIGSLTEKDILEIYFKQGNILLSNIEKTHIGGSN